VRCLRRYVKGWSSRRPSVLRGTHRVDQGLLAAYPVAGRCRQYRPYLCAGEITRFLWSNVRGFELVVPIVSWSEAPLISSVSIRSVLGLIERCQAGLCAGLEVPTGSERLDGGCNYVYQFWNSVDTPPGCRGCIGCSGFRACP
jgi:hypothetical protein